MSKRKSQSKPSVRPPAVLPAGQSGQLPATVGIVAVSIAIAFAVVLRFWASLDNFWLDEIWSWMMAGQLKSPLEVVTRLHHDNNHYVNTFVLYTLGGDAPTYLYRLPAVLAGIGAVLLSGWVARRWSPSAGVTAMILTGCSFLMIQYSA